MFFAAALFLEVVDPLADDFGRCELVKQQIEAPIGNLLDRCFAAGAHPDRRVRLLPSGLLATEHRF
jgi:hypothetical protein